MAVERYAFVNDLADSDLYALTTAEGESQADVVREAQLAYSGEFVSGRYGRFKISEQDIDSMVANHATQAHPVAPTELSVDYDHKEGEAAGWIKRVWKKVVGAGAARRVELWGSVAWTKDAADKIATRKYRFFSPMFDKTFATPLGRKIGATLLGGALTNRPFLQGMAAVTCSMGEDDHALPVVPQRSASMKLFKTKDAQGNDVEIDLDAIKDAPEVKALSAAAAAPAVPVDAISAAVKAAVEPLATQVVAMQGTVTNLSAALNQQKVDAVKGEAERLIDAATKEGKVVPAEKENLLRLSAIEGGMDILKVNLAARQPVILLNHQHGDGTAGSADAAADEAVRIGEVDVTLSNADEVFTREVDKARTERKLSSDEAMRVIEREQPALARKYQLSFRRA